MSNATSIVTGVDFVMVPTEDYDAAVKFYGEVLGLPCSAVYGRRPGSEFETGNLTLAVIQSDQMGMEFHRNLNPIALRVQDVAAARAALEARGVVFKADTLDTTVCHMAFFEDPDGNRLMLHSRYAPRSPAPGAE